MAPLLAYEKNNSLSLGIRGQQDCLRRAAGAVCFVSSEVDMPRRIVLC